jgi:serine/threonine-protein kinase HipA
VVERTVFLHLPGEADAVPAGRLRMIEQGLQVEGSRFAYGRRYVARENAVPVDPVSLALTPHVDDEERVPANGLALFGALRDATPDAWGRRVIENRLRAPPNGLPESVYLDHAGPHRAGALDVRESPTSLPTRSALPEMLDLQHLLDAAARIEESEPVPAHLDAFFAGGASVGGARPKAVLTADGTEWIAKFPARNDAFNVPRVERAVLELARDAGLAVPRTRLETLADGRQAMLIERFDRESRDGGSVGRRHMVSALTLLAVHEQESADSSYAAIADAIGVHGVTGRIAVDRAELYARMVFNILVSNDDDHLRNHAFLFDAQGEGWRLSPLYDVVPRPQLSEERRLRLSIGPQGRSARLDNALAGAGRFGLLAPAAATIIDRVVSAVRGWRDRFEGLGVPARECDRVASAFRRAADIGMRDVERQR